MQSSFTIPPLYQPACVAGKHSVTVEPGAYIGRFRRRLGCDEELCIGSGDGHSVDDDERYPEERPLPVERPEITISEDETFDEEADGNAGSWAARKPMRVHASALIDGFCEVYAVVVYGLFVLAASAYLAQGASGLFRAIAGRILPFLGM